MQHFASGGKVEVWPYQGSWIPTVVPLWDWHTTDYRIAQSPIAQGHNPERLTEEQVGVKDGWRLISREEQEPWKGRIMQGDLVEVLWNCGQWIPSGIGGVIFTYRTKQPVGYFLPKTKTRVPLEAKDIPAVCWLKNSSKHAQYFVHGVTMYSVQFGTVFESQFASLWAEGWEYSSDRITWKPCQTSEP